MFKIEQTLFKLFKPQKLNCTCSLLKKFNPQSVVFLRNSHISSITHVSGQKFKGIENEYMFKLLPKKNFPYPLTEELENVETTEQFEDILRKNYREESATKILETFKTVEKFCCHNQINITDPRFDNLVDGLMDHCRSLTDNQLLELLQLLARFPRCETYRDHNYHDVWSCLDDISCERLANTDIEFLLQLAEVWYQLDLGKLGEYIFTLIDVLARKSNQLTKDQVVKAFFYLNVCRRKQVPFNLEERVEKHLEKFNIDELGIIALGYFKSQSKIKLKTIVVAMMDAVEKECSSVNQITLSSILKVIRFSQVGPFVLELDRMLDNLLKEIDRLSIQCCLHIAIIGSTMNHYHEKSMNETVRKIVSKMENTQEVRLKDIERVLIATTMVDYRPKVTPDLCEKAFDEIHQNRRIVELASFPRILPCILGCLSMVKMYSYDLMDRVLDKSYIFNAYGKHVGSISKDVLSLDYCIELECPDYKGNRLPTDLRYKLAKWSIEFIPSYNQPKKLTVYDKIHLDVEDNIISIVGNRDAVKADHVVPHFGRADLILCKDKAANEFVEPPGFERYILGDLKHVLKDPNLEWYAVSVIGWNNTIRTTSRPVGLVKMKQRHLELLGYNSRLVIWNQYTILSKKRKIEYLRNLLR